MKCITQGGKVSNPVGIRIFAVEPLWFATVTKILSEGRGLAALHPEGFLGTITLAASFNYQLIP